jgi:hypothetical protein
MSIVPEVEPTVYLVLDDYGPKIGRAYVNTDELQSTEEATIDYMLRGEYSNPVRVVAFNTAEGWSRDMSVPIAQAVLLRATDGKRDYHTAVCSYCGDVMVEWFGRARHYRRKKRPRDAAQFAKNVVDIARETAAVKRGARGPLVCPISAEASTAVGRRRRTSAGSRARPSRVR